MSRTIRSLKSALAPLAAIALIAMVDPALAASAKPPERANASVSEVEQAAQKLAANPVKTKQINVNQLMAQAELHLRTGQHDIAIDKLNQLIELRAQGKGSAAMDADAHYMLGEAYFATEQLYSARRHFRVVTDHAEDPVYAGLGGPAASRLVDITLRIQRNEDLDDVLARVDRMIARSSNESLVYARSKALFAMGRYDECQQEAAKIATGEYGQRAAYLRGTALMKQAQGAVDPKDEFARPDYTAALAAFNEATRAPGGVAPSPAAQSQVTDLAWLAVARLQYESQSYRTAAQAYEKIQRGSPFFAEALFEIAWTYVRLGDYSRGQRALEALAVLSPGLIDGADGELLRADLLLRQGRFAAADEAYEAIRAKYDPLRDQVDRFLAEHDDPSVYYDKLTAAEIETGTELPELAIDWAREEAQEERVFAIVDDVSRSRQLIKRSRRIVTLLRASLGSTSRAKVFPEIESQLIDVVGLLNQLAVARLTMARGMDDEAGDGNGELKAVRAERRKLMARLGQVPTNPGDFSVRASQAEQSWNQVSQSLQRLQLEADHLRALVNGLQQVLLNAERHGVNEDAATIERYRQEIVENEKDLAVYTRRIDELREQIEIGRVQSGLGDERFTEDEAVRVKFRELFAKEVQLAMSSGDKDEVSYAKQVQPVLTRMLTIEGRLESLRGQLDSNALSRAKEVRETLEVEAKAIEIYASQLDTMDQHARVLVGDVARANFVKARDRIKDVVLRADVGLVQQAWEVREEQKERVRDLLRERAQEERFINDELREVLDDEEGQ